MGLNVSLFLLEGYVVALKIAVSEEELSVAVEECLARLLAEAKSNLVAVSDVVSVNARINHDRATIVRIESNG